MIKDYILLALKNVKNRGIRSWLTMLGIFIGIVALVSLISLGNGLQQAVTGQFSTLSADRLLVTNAETGFGPPGSTSIKKLTEHDLKIIESINGVKIAIPRLMRITKVEYEQEATYEFLGSLPNIKEKTQALYETFNLEAEKGRLFGSEDRGKIILGKHIAEEHFENIEIGKTLKISGKNFEVTGILKQTGTILNNAIFMNEENIKNIL